MLPGKTTHDAGDTRREKIGMSFRIEKKIVLKKSRLADAISYLKSIDAEYIYQKRPIFSYYFDNEKISMFTDSEEGILPRKKIRIRVYSISGDFNSGGTLETKISSIEGRFKKSENLDKEGVEKIFDDGIFDQMYGFCQRVLQVRYMREYFQTKTARVTLDTDIEYSLAGATDWVPDPEISMEIKAGWLSSDDQLSKEFPFMQGRFSKYARGCAFSQLKSPWP